MCFAYRKHSINIFIGINKMLCVVMHWACKQCESLLSGLERFHFSVCPSVHQHLVPPRRIVNLLGSVKVKVLVAKSCLTLWGLMDCSPSGSSVHGILQARILEWVAVPFSRGSFRPRDQTQVSFIAGRFFTIWATRDGMDRGKPIPLKEILSFFCATSQP